MLQKIHEKTKGWFATAILAIVCLVFVLWGVENYVGGRGGKSAVLAKVAGHKILAGDLVPAVRQMQQQYISSGQPMSDAVMQQIKNLALQNLVSQFVLLEAAKKLGFVISEDQARQFLMQLPAFSDQGQFSPVKFQRYADSVGLSPLQAFEQIKLSLLIDQVMGGVESSVFTLPDENKYFYQLFNQTRDIRYLELPISAFNKDLHVSDDLVKTYYENNREALREPDQVSIQYILLSLDQLRQQVKISDQAISAFYQAHQNNYRDAAQKLKPLAQVKDSIRSSLAEQKVQRRFAHQSEQLSELTYTNAGSLEPAAKALGLVVKQTEAFSAQGGVGSLSQRAVVEAAFSSSVLQDKNNSGVLTLDNGDLVVLRIKQYYPSDVPPLDKIKAKIIVQLKKEMAESRASLLANQLIEAIHQGADPVKLAAQHGFSWRNVMGLTRTNKKQPTDLVTAAFNAEKGQQAAIQTTLKNANPVIILVDSIFYPDYKKSSSKEQDAFTAKIQQMLADLTYQFYLLSLQRSIPVKIYAAADQVD
jgi:peptidyl-prolyl cis-trans isomerase D